MSHARNAREFPLFQVVSESTAPDRIWLDKTKPMQQWVKRDSGTKSTIVVMQVMLAE